MDFGHNSVYIIAAVQHVQCRLFVLEISQRVSAVIVCISPLYYLRITLITEWLFDVKLGFRTSSFRLKDNCVKSN